MAEDAGLSIVIERHDDRTLLALRGELDLATAPLLANALNDANREVVVDLGDLAFVDASGLHVLARAGERMETHHNRLVVVNAGPMAQRIFELTGLDHLLSGSDAP